nr:acetylajmalan esterase-like [Ipomoea batatas]GMD58482.1 acetylajmalan esterase-like [Ipomoea batatas]GME20286.1 acetylajmalan esterase-like [Ipomoea batatas]GME21298.1 acetylajmalan esterase-like [Ipomoea batatas]
MTTSISSIGGGRASEEVKTCVPYVSGETAPYTYLALFISLFPFLYASASPSSLCSFKYIYQFGDSLADTGNLIRIPGALSTFHADRLPYGQSFFHRPTGRYSNGRLIIDYTAAALHLPLTPPYLDFNASFTHGANFAVAGATALDQAFFVGKNISIPSFRPPISGQLRWFQSHLNSTCHARSKCVRRRLRDAFFVFGAFGGNDYYNAVFRGKSVEEVRTYVPDIVNAVILGIKRVVGLGAKRVVVPGTYPSGCLPVYLTAFGTSDPKAYDDLGCLKKFNEYSFYYNSHLRKAVSVLGEELSGDAVIVYADYYGALRSVLRRGSSLGFEKESLLKACCGTGGKYNFDSKKTCGSEGVPVCSKPDRFVSWDGTHLTEQANRLVSQLVIDQVFRKMKCA